MTMQEINKKRKVKEVFVFQNRGFTLIELLIVIVIIGILSTVVIANFVGIRARARDAQRKTDLRQIQTALQLYYSDNGYFPPDTDFPDCGGPFSADTVTYMQEVPCDPIGEGLSYHYESYTTGGLGGCVAQPDGSYICESYKLYACLENGSDSEIDEVQEDCGDEGSNRHSFTVINP